MERITSRFSLLSCKFPLLAWILNILIMKTNLSSTTPSQLETDCLVVVVLDRNEKDKSAPSIECDDDAVVAAAKDVIASGEVTGKSFETTLLHNPTGLKAKRLLLIGGGKAKDFSAAELRKIAGTAVRTLKGKSIRRFAFAHSGAVPSPFAIRAIVEGATIGDFDPGYYKSDRKDKDKSQKIDAVTIVVRKRGREIRPSCSRNWTHHRRIAEFHPRPGQ